MNENLTTKLGLCINPYEVVLDDTIDLEYLTGDYGLLANCKSDEKVLSKILLKAYENREEISELVNLTYKYEELEKLIKEKINFFESLKFKYVLIIPEHLKENENDVFSLQYVIKKYSIRKKKRVPPLQRSKWGGEFSSLEEITKNIIV